MRVDEFDYALPQEAIAQKPVEPRDSSRLMVLDRRDGTVVHRRFSEIGEFLKPGDCLVVNDSKVLPARLFGIKDGTGASIEFLLLQRIEGDVWNCMVRPGRRVKPDDVIRFGEGLECRILDYGPDGTRMAEFHFQGSFMDRLEELGHVPLPPYIERPDESFDKERYQTVYCKQEGSVAAPTAGLHFTGRLLDDLKSAGVSVARVTLHVGIGTFRPVKVEAVEEHVMHFEEYEISEVNAGLINAAKEKGGRIVAVGTTSARTLESSCVQEPDGTWKIAAKQGSTGIFIYPGYSFRMTDALVTNFHLPKSTLLMLVSAFYDRERVLEAYRQALASGYRFFSYGDAMLIL